MPQIIDYQPTTDNLDHPDTLQFAPASNVQYLSFNVLVQPAFVQFWKPVPGQTGKYALDEVIRKYAAGTIGAVARNVAGARFASAVPGQPATIYAEMAFTTDVQVEGGTVTGAQVASNGQVVLPSILVGGFVDSNGSIVVGSGFGVARTGTGTYVVTFTAPYSARPIIVASLANSGNPFVNGETLVVSSISSLGFQVNVFDASGVSADVPFTFLSTLIA